MSIYSKINEARMMLQKEQILMSGHNRFSDIRYFVLGDFMPQIKQIFSKLGLCGIVSFTNDEASLIVTDTESGEHIIITSPMRSAQLKGCHDIQNLGAVETYQRRYLYVTLMEIEEHDAIDNSKPLEEVKEENKLPDYTISQVEDNSEKWIKAINSGKHTPKSIISAIKMQYTLTDDVVYLINNLV